MIKGVNMCEPRDAIDLAYISQGGQVISLTTSTSEKVVQIMANCSFARQLYTSAR